MVRLVIEGQLKPIGSADSERQVQSVGPIQTESVAEQAGLRPNVRRLQVKLKGAHDQFGYSPLQRSLARRLKVRRLASLIFQERSIALSHHTMRSAPTGRNTRKTNG